MKQKFIPYIYVLFSAILPYAVFGQNFTLKISSKDTKDSLILNEIDFQKNHSDSASAYNEINKTSSFLKNLGYFTNTVDSISKIDKNLVAHFSLGQKIERVVIYKSNYPLKLINTDAKNDSIFLPIEKLEETLNSISEKLETQGKSFSKVQLKNIILKEKILFAELKVHQSKKRNIDSILIKGYELFPKKYIKHYFNISQKNIINTQKIKEISKASKSLAFVKEIKSPEILFTNDSTFLYLYFKKIQNNSFDGLINFTSKDNGDVLFNGHIDLKLNNILNSGESFDLFWNSIGEEKQEFIVTAEIPFIVNTAFTPKLFFSIYKQDSTFLNTKFHVDFAYNLNSKSSIGLTYTTEVSDNLQKNNSNNRVNTFDNYFLGIKYRYSIPKKDTFLDNKFYLEINPTFGRRNSLGLSTNQFKINFSATYLWELNFRHSIHLQNKSGYLNSTNFMDNELFRIGGANSIRGFDEQSIYTNSFSFFNIEYRYLTSQSSYLYSISDFGKVTILEKNENLLGLGIGYTFSINTSQISLSSVIGKSSESNFDFKKSKIIINWRILF